MDILIGILNLFILGSVVLFFASLAISQYQKRHIVKKTNNEDAYSYLFDIYRN